MERVVVFGMYLLMKKTVHGVLLFKKTVSVHIRSDTVFLPKPSIRIRPMFLNKTAVHDMSPFVSTYNNVSDSTRHSLTYWSSLRGNITCYFRAKNVLPVLDYRILHLTTPGSILMTRLTFHLENLHHFESKSKQNVNANVLPLSQFQYTSRMLTMAQVVLAVGTSVLPAPQWKSYQAVLTVGTSVLPALLGLKGALPPRQPSH